MKKWAVVDPNYQAILLVIESDTEPEVPPNLRYGGRSVLEYDDLPMWLVERYLKHMT